MTDLLFTTIFIFVLSQKKIIFFSQRNRINHTVIHTTEITTYTGLYNYYFTTKYKKSNLIVYTHHSICTCIN